MKIIAVDDERIALEDFKETCAEIGGIESIVTFSNPLDALQYAAREGVDAAFLDIEMPIIKGIELAKRLKALQPNIRIIFTTGYSDYALEAFGADAVDYVLKPYTAKTLGRAIEKAKLIRDVEGKPNVFAKTFGYFDLFVEGKPVVFTSSKSKELLALLIDRRGGVVSTEQAINFLWAGREYDDAVQSLFRKVLKSLRIVLEEMGVSEILVDNRNQRAVDTAKFSCDYYDFLEKKPEAVKDYFGEYMSQYRWAESTQKQLESLVGQ